MALPLTSSFKLSQVIYVFVSETENDGTPSNLSETLPERGRLKKAAPDGEPSLIKVGRNVSERFVLSSSLPRKLMSMPQPGHLSIVSRAASEALPNEGERNLHEHSKFRHTALRSWAANSVEVCLFLWFIGVNTYLNRP